MIARFPVLPAIPFGKKETKFVLIGERNLEYGDPNREEECIHENMRLLVGFLLSQMAIQGQEIFLEEVMKLKQELEGAVNKNPDGLFVQFDILKPLQQEFENKFVIKEEEE